VKTYEKSIPLITTAQDWAAVDPNLSPGTKSRKKVRKKRTVPTQAELAALTPHCLVHLDILGDLCRSTVVITSIQGEEVEGFVVSDPVPDLAFQTYGLLAGSTIEFQIRHIITIGDSEDYLTFAEECDGPAPQIALQLLQKGAELFPEETKIPVAIEELKKWLSEQDEGGSASGGLQETPMGNLINAWQMVEDYQSKYRVYSPEQIDSIQPGDLVQISHESEWYWVEVDRKEGVLIVGRIIARSLSPNVIPKPKGSNEMRLRPENIYAIQKKEREPDTESGEETQTE